jgi:hypothetical protein
MKRGETRKGQSGIAYLWNIIDRESRFLIASKRSEKRDINGAVQAFNEAIKNSHDQKPHGSSNLLLFGFSYKFL